MEKTIREYIKEYSDRLRSADNLSPDEAARMLVELTSLLASLNAKITSSECDYNQVHAYLEGSESAVKAKIKAMAGREYREWQEQKAWGRSLEELIRSVKVFIRSSMEEFKHN